MRCNDLLDVNLSLFDGGASAGGGGEGALSLIHI